RGDGPTFLVLNTYRFHGHHVGDVDRSYYRSEEEETEWKSERDPIELLTGWLREQGVVAETLAQIGSEAQQEVEAGVEFALAAAMTGMRPVVDIMFGDFMTLVMDQLVNQAAKIHYMSGGRLKAPLTIRTTLGATRRSAAQHSQSLHALVAHVPGVKVVLPATPYDAKGLFKSAIRDDNPVVVFEDKMMF